MQSFKKLHDADQAMRQSMQERLNQQLLADQDQKEAYAVAMHSPAFLTRKWPLSRRKKLTPKLN